jgi:hypothetical protein
MSDSNPDRRTDATTSDPDTRTDTTTTDRHAGTDDILNTDMMKWVSALAAIVGLWIVASPFIFESTDTAVWNNTLVGTAIFALAGYNFVRMSQNMLALVGIAALVVLLGLWIAASPYVIDMGSQELENSSIIAGILVALLSAFNAYENSRAEVAEGTRAGT